ncbi:MAG: hypothetical protein ABI688_12420 [Bacteroidota bacterium]
MQKKNWISVGFIAAILTASILMLNASAPQKEQATCCKKVSTPCPMKLKKETPGEATLENLSRQFISLPMILN